MLALVGRNNDKGGGTAVDFAEAVDTLRDRVRIIIQRGRIARPIALPRIAGILDQFVVEQDHDESERSWHPKIALVAYDCPKGATRWKLWVGSRNLTRSRDLDAGVMLDGSEKRSTGRVRLRGVGALGATLARIASRKDADDIATQLEAVWWEAPVGFKLRTLLNGLDEGVALPAEPPTGAIDSITIISPFLSPDFLQRAGAWQAGSRTLVSSMPALVDMANRSSNPLKGFSRILAYAAPSVLADEVPSTPPGAEAASEEDAEPAPLALHAKIYCFRSGATTVLRVGSANATERAWSRRNSEIMVELEAGEAFASGLEFLIGKATPVTIEELGAADAPGATAADALEKSRKALLASWKPILRRDGERFAIEAGTVPLLAYPEHRLQVGPANGDFLAWPPNAVRLDLGTIPLPHQSTFIQVRIGSPDAALQWMQRVAVEPPLDEQRDLAALASHKGLRAFHDWMRAMLSGDTLPVGGGAWDEDAGSRGGRNRGLGYDRLTLEDILMAWTRDRKAFDRIDRHFAPYIDALLAYGDNLTERERADLNELAQIWAIVRTRLAA